MRQALVPLTTRVRKCVPTTVMNCNNARNCIIISVDDRHYFLIKEKVIFKSEFVFLRGVENHICDLHVLLDYDMPLIVHSVGN